MGFLNALLGLVADKIQLAGGNLIVFRRRLEYRIERAVHNLESIRRDGRDLGLVAIGKRFLHVGNLAQKALVDNLVRTARGLGAPHHTRIRKQLPELFL